MHLECPKGFFYHRSQTSILDPFGIGQTMIPQYMMPQTAYHITDANQTCKNEIQTPSGDHNCS